MVAFLKSFQVGLVLHTIYAYIAYMKDIQYTIRGIPGKINSKIRKKAKEEGKSLNKVVIEALSRGLGLTEEPHQYNDLDDLVGTWVEDPEFDAAIKAMDQIDPDLWR